MILQQLYDDSDSILGNEKPPVMYDWQVVRWIIDITVDGQLKSITPLGDKYGVRQLLPYNYGRSVDIVPNLLTDLAEYALGVIGNKGDEKHTAFRSLLTRCAETVNEPLVDAVVRFLEAGGVSLEEVKERGIQAKERVVFTVDGQWPTELAAVHQFWDDLTARECKGKPKQDGICLVTGRLGAVEAILPCEISIGRESAPIISVNDKAAYSYGFEQAYNGAVSRDAAEGFTKALNALMHRDRSHFRMVLNRDGSDEMVYVFWAKQAGEEDVYAAVAEQPDTQLVERIFRSVLDGERVSDSAVDANQFFALAITGNKTRVVFRDWLETTLPEVKQRLRLWFLAQRLVNYDGETKYFSIKQSAGALYRRDSKGKLLEKVTPRVLRALLRAALHGEAIPRELLSRAVVRCRTEHFVSNVRATLIKTALTLNNEEEANSMTRLDPDNSDPPYVCGRLLALLDSIQYQAQGEVNSNIIDRYFGAAAATPGRILPLLIKKAENAHLPKIRRQKGRGAYNAIHGELYKIHELLPVTSYPTLLSLEEQGRFMLGFYHQQAARIKKAKDAKASAVSTSQGTTNIVTDKEEHENV